MPQGLIFSFTYGVNAFLNNPATISHTVLIKAPNFREALALFQDQVPGRTAHIIDVHRIFGEVL
jgi:hypothetical protein